MTKRSLFIIPDPAAVPGGARSGAERAAPSAPAHSVLAVLREWLDALIIASVLAMFVRLFIVELFKIPTGSMTPTLIGGRVADVDYDRDGRKDLLLFLGEGDRPLLFLNDGRRLISKGRVDVGLGEVRSHLRHDHILVNKLAYWLSPPRRGDIVVFKVPPVIWQPDKPIYIKRCVGAPGDLLTFDPLGHLRANGDTVLEPEFFRTQRYELSLPRLKSNQDPPEISYDVSRADPTQRTIRGIQVPADKIYVFGDNTLSSQDSRYWGGVPLDNVKGRAFFRYYPFSEMRFLHGG